MTKPVARIIAEDANLANLLRTAQSLRRATQSMRSVLDPVFLEHCAVARLETQRVVVVTDGAVWASRMRYLVPQLRRHFAHYLGTVDTPDVEIKVHSTPIAAPTREARPLSAASRESIGRSAAAMPPGRLRETLERLAGMATPGEPER